MRARVYCIDTIDTRFICYRCLRWFSAAYDKEVFVKESDYICVCVCVCVKSMSACVWIVYAVQVFAHVHAELATSRRTLSK